VLEEGVVWVALGEGCLVGVREVQVVEAQNQGVEAALGAQGGAEGGDQSTLAGALDAIDADEEGSGGGVGMDLMTREDEGNAVT